MGLGMTRREAEVLEGKVVLVVEDEPLVRGMARRAIQRFGSEVIVAGSAAEALEALASADVDVVLTDLSLPGADGFELAAQLERDHPSLPVVLMSGRGRGDVDADSRASGRVFIEKPFSIGALRDALAKALERAFEHA